MSGHFLTIGKIVSVRGLKGEVNVIPTTDFPSARFAKRNTVYLYDGKTEDRMETVIEHAVQHRGSMRVKLRGIKCVEEAETLINYFIQVEKKESFLEPNTFYHQDLEECKVFDEKHSFIGIVKRVESYSAQRSLRIAREGKKDALVPFVKAFIVDVSIPNKEVIIHTIDGLL